DPMIRRTVRHVLPCMVVVACLVPPLSAVILEQRKYHGKNVLCLHSGLIGVARSCGTQGYERVFTGTVTSSVDVGDTDKNLEIVPDEVFVGDSSKVRAITNQACLRSEIRTGDKWLFYLSHDPKGNTLVLSYDSPSKPVTDAEDNLSMLRD